MVTENPRGDARRTTTTPYRRPAKANATLVWAVLDLLITHETNGIRFTELDRQRLNHVKYAEPEQTTEEVTGR